MNIEEVEEPKKYENDQAKPVSDPFKSIADHRKAREFPCSGLVSKVSCTICATVWGPLRCNLNFNETEGVPKYKHDGK